MPQNAEFLDKIFKSLVSAESLSSSSWRHCSPISSINSSVYTPNENLDKPLFGQWFMTIVGFRIHNIAGMPRFMECIIEFLKVSRRVRVVSYLHKLDANLVI